MEYEQARILKEYIEQLQHEAFEEGFKIASEQGQRHGRNISENGFLCSECTFGDFGGFHNYKPKYCPNCGAKMDEEVQDE